MARRRGERIRVYVNISGNRKYGFQTQKSVVNRYKSQLGMTEFQGAAGVFFGANSPKPARATFEEADGSTSSFCSNNKIDDLKKLQNCTVNSNGVRIRGIKVSGKTRTVFVDMPGGWKYAWNITAAEAGLAAELGFELATGSQASELVWGVGEPKPPRASKRTAEGTVSTFIKPQASVIEAAVAKGWTVSSVNYDLIPNA
jgi:hypothetical protein